MLTPMVMVLTRRVVPLGREVITQGTLAFTAL